MFICRGPDESAEKKYKQNRNMAMKFTYQSQKRSLKFRKQTEQFHKKNQNQNHKKNHKSWSFR